MKEHLKKHKLKEPHKKKHFYVLCDMSYGYYRNHKGGEITYTSHIDKAKKFNTQKEAEEYFKKIRAQLYSPSHLLIGHSKNSLIQMLGTRLNGRQYEE